MIRRILNKCITPFGRSLFQPKGIYEIQDPSSVIVLTPGRIPTTDLYLTSRLADEFGVAVHYVNILAPSESLHISKGTLIVVVRFAPMRWLRLLKEQQSLLAGVVFLMDDDIPAALQASELPLRYALKTAWRYARTRRMLGQLCSEVWVSTPELRRRYAWANPKLIEPEYIAVQSTAKMSCTYFYHGSWAHRDEMAWLVPVISAVQKAVPEAWFEIIGTDKVRRLFRDIARVRVIKPMPWPDYLAYAGSVRYLVGLAPCFDTPFNRARSHSKIFDITRLGAAGIYSAVSPYSEKVAHFQTGILCDNDQDAWVTSICSLLQDYDLRANIYQRALGWCENVSLSHNKIR